MIRARPTPVPPLPALLACIAVLSCPLLPRPAHAQPCEQPACAEAFPAGAGAIDVRAYGAKGDGRTDDTAAIRAALDASGGDTGREVWRDRVVYLPPGTYLVSGTLEKHYADGRFGSGLILVGASPTRTVIRLKDGAAGFGDPRAPRGVVMTSSKRLDMAGGRDYAHLGEGNDAYENFVENLAIDVGQHNPGAIGIDDLANNLGAIRDVAIRAPASSGAVGISMLRRWPGPALIQRVSVDGFETGIAIDQSEYGMTLSQVRLRGQRGTGLRNDGNVVSAEALSVEGAGGPPIDNSAPGGLLVLAGGSLTGTLRNQGTIVFHGTGLGAAPPGMPGPGKANGWLEGGAWHAAAPWSLPLPQAPVVDAGPVERWASIAAPAPGDLRADATARIQAAFDSGAATVYFQHGIYWISAGLRVPPGLRRIVGMNAALRVLPEKQSPALREGGMVRIEAGDAPLQIERLALDNTDQGEQTGFVLSAPRRLLLRDIFGMGVRTLDRRAPGGDAFMEDTCCGTLRLAGPREVVARQFDTEGPGTRIVNEGSRLAILGIKTERECTVARTNGDGRTEILGGLLYMVQHPADPSITAFVAHGPGLVASFAEEVKRPGDRYSVYLANETGSDRLMAAETGSPRGFGRIVPLLRSGAAGSGR